MTHFYSMASIKEEEVLSNMVLFATFVLSYHLIPLPVFSEFFLGALAAGLLPCPLPRAFQTPLDSDDGGCPLTPSSFTVQTCSLPPLSSLMPEVFPAQPSPDSIPALPQVFC